MQSNYLKVLDDLETTVQSTGFVRGIQLGGEFSGKLESQREGIQKLIGALDEKIEAASKLEKTQPTEEGAVAQKLLGELPKESRILLLKVLGETDEAVRKMGRHLLANAVIDPNGNEVWITIKTLAAALNAWFEKVGLKESEEVFPPPALILGNGMINTRDLNGKAILKIPLVNGYRATSKYYEAYKGVRDSIPPDAIKKRTEASEDLALLRALGAEIHRAAAPDVIKSINVNKTKAIEWLKTILNGTNEIMKAEIPEGEPIQTLDFDNDLEVMHLMHLTRIMFDRKVDSAVREEAQMLLRMTFEMMNIRSSDAYTATGKYKKTVQTDFATVFIPDTFEEVLLDELEFDETGNIIKIRSNRVSKQARVIEVDTLNGKERVRALWTPFDEKGAGPILTKMMTRETSQEADEVRDHLRCALEFPDISIIDLINKPEKKALMFSALIKAGEAIGLTYIPYEDTNELKKLKPGEFTVEDNTGENNTEESKKLFQNMKAVGILADEYDPTCIGTTVEIQANPGDLIRIVEGKNSPFKHSAYDKLRNAETARNILSRSRRPQAHRALNSYIGKTKERRKTALASAQDWLNEKISPLHSPSPAPQAPLG